MINGVTINCYKEEGERVFGQKNWDADKAQKQLEILHWKRKMDTKFN